MIHRIIKYTNRMTHRVSKYTNRMTHRLFITTWLLCSLQMLQAADVTITVSNTTDRQRQEVVAIDLQTVRQRLAIGKDDAFVVRNAFGQEVDYQCTYDSLLLIDVAVKPEDKAVFHISKGTPRQPRSYVQGAVYPLRKDDLAWENDRAAYRVYGPALQRSGERSFGTDVWVKNTPDLVVAERYRIDYEGNQQEDSLRKAGKKDEARRIDLLTSFHLDHGNGMDAYGVGPTLGCGAPALMKDGQLVFPYCYQTCRILDNGPLRFTAELNYGANADGQTEHRRIVLDKGSHFSRITVWYDSIARPVSFATGVVLHDHRLPLLGSDYVAYTDPTDNPTRHHSQIYVGVLFPDGANRTVVLEGSHSHAVGIIDNYSGQPLTYYAGAAWSSYDVPNEAHWLLCIDDLRNQLRNPLAVDIQ